MLLAAGRIVYLMYHDNCNDEHKVQAVLVTLFKAK